MKILSKSQMQKIAGGVQYLEVVSKVTIDGIPEDCIQHFFSTHQSTMSNMVLDDLTSKITSHCNAHLNTLHRYISIEDSPVAITLITE